MAQCVGGRGGVSSHHHHRRAAQKEIAVESICQGLLDDVMVVGDEKYRAMCGAFGYLQQQEWAPDLGGLCYAGFGAPPPTAAAQDASNGTSSFSCSDSGGSATASGRKRRPDGSHLDAKGESGSACKRTARGKQQQLLLRDLGAGKGKQERARAGGRKNKAELALCKDSRAAASTVTAAGQKTDYIHVRARRGQATDSHSLAERVRRERISERMRYLQELVPGCNKVTGKAGMLDEIINYVQSLQKQVEFLSMKIAASNPVVNFNIVEDLFGRQLAGQACDPAALSGVALPAGQLEPPCIQMSPMQPSAGSPGFGLEMVVNNPYPPAPAAAAMSVPAGASVESCLNVNGAPAWDIGAQNLFGGFDAQFQSVQSDCLLDNLKMEM